MPDKESCGPSEEFLKMRRLVLRERARRERALVEKARLKRMMLPGCLKKITGWSRSTFTGPWHGAALQRVRISTSWL